MHSLHECLTRVEVSRYVVEGTRGRWLVDWGLSGVVSVHHTLLWSWSSLPRAWTGPLSRPVVLSVGPRVGRHWSKKRGPGRMSMVDTLLSLLKL